MKNIAFIFFFLTGCASMSQNQSMSFGEEDLIIAGQVSHNEKTIKTCYPIFPNGKDREAFLREFKASKLTADHDGVMMVTKANRETLVFKIKDDESLKKAYDLCLAMEKIYSLQGYKINN